MTVAELISALQKLPQDLPVYVADWNERYAGDSELTSGTIEEPYESRDGSIVPRRLTLMSDGKDDLSAG